MEENRRYKEESEGYHAGETEKRRIEENEGLQTDIEAGRGEAASREEPTNERADEAADSDDQGTTPVEVERRS